jgi:hypothetical protein
MLRPIPFVLRAIAALGIVLAVAGQSGATAQAPLPNDGATIVLARGLVLTVGVDGTLMATGDGGHLNPGEQLLTGEDSEAVVRFPDGGELILTRQSWVQLADYAWDGKTGRNVLVVKLGGVRWTGGAMPPGKVVLRNGMTETVTIGTQIVMVVFPDGSTHEGVWDGGAKVRSLVDGKSYTLPKGRGATVRKGPNKTDPNKPSGVTEQLNGYQNWDQKTINAYAAELRDYILQTQLQGNAFTSNHDLLEWMKIWSRTLTGEDQRKETKAKLTVSQQNGFEPQFFDYTYQDKLFDAVLAIWELQTGLRDANYAADLKKLQKARKDAQAILDSAYPNTMTLFPKTYDNYEWNETTKKWEWKDKQKDGKVINPLVTDLGVAVDVPRVSIYDDPTISDSWSVFKGSWEEGLEPGVRQRTVSARYAAKTALDNLKANTSAIGSGSGLRSFDSGSDPDDRNNDVPVGIFLVNSGNLQETAWAVIEGGTVNFYEGDAYGPIRAPGGGYIEALNNDGRFQAVMVKEFKLGDDQRLFSLQGFAKFVTTEFPNFIGSQFNDTTKITLTTPGGQSVTLSGAQLFGASVNTSNFTAVSGLPAPLAGWDGGGETAWQALFQRLRVAPGGRVRITVTVNNVGDRNYPSTTLLGGLKGSGSR